MNNKEIKKYKIIYNSQFNNDNKEFTNKEFTMEEIFKLLVKRINNLYEYCESLECIVSGESGCKSYINKVEEIK